MTFTKKQKIMLVSDFLEIATKLKHTQELLDKVHVSSIGRNREIRDIIEGFIYHAIVRDELIKKIPDLLDISENTRLLRPSTETILLSIDTWCSDILIYIKTDIIPNLQKLEKIN